MCLSKNDNQRFYMSNQLCIDSNFSSLFLTSVLCISFHPLIMVTKIYDSVDISSLKYTI